MHWLEKIERNSLEHRLLSEGETVVAAVSGGVDSMVLLTALHRLSEKYRYRLAVAHFNHHLRGRSSDADEKLVAETAAAMGLLCTIGGDDIRALAHETGVSVEMAARKARHDFFADVARKIAPSGKRIIALAHHADDQVELFFLRLLRGAGGDGLSGMDWISQSPADTKASLIRPLLNFTKQELLAIAKKERIRFREDATNAEIDFLRNRIRHELVPVLNKIQPSAAGTILRTMEIVGTESQAVQSAALAWLKAGERSDFQKLPIGVQRQVLQCQIRDLGFEENFDLIEHLRRFPGSPISISPEFSLLRNGHGIVSTKKSVGFDFSEDILKIDLTAESSARFANREISWRFESMAGAEFKRRKNCELFDAERVGNEITLRHWRRGDRFQPIGMKTPVKLQDLFTNQKVSQEERHSRIIAVSEGGEIFWVEGLRIGENFKLRSDTKRRLTWYF